MKIYFSGLLALTLAQDCYAFERANEGQIRAHLSMIGYDKASTLTSTQIEQLKAKFPKKKPTTVDEVNFVLFSDAGKAAATVAQLQSERDAAEAEKLRALEDAKRAEEQTQRAIDAAKSTTSAEAAAKFMAMQRIERERTAAAEQRAKEAEQKVKEIEIQKAQLLKAAGASTSEDLKKRMAALASAGVAPTSVAGLAAVTASLGSSLHTSSAGAGDAPTPQAPFLPKTDSKIKTFEESISFSFEGTPIVNFSQARTLFETLKSDESRKAEFEKLKEAINKKMKEEIEKSTETGFPTNHGLSVEGTANFSGIRTAFLYLDSEDNKFLKARNSLWIFMASKYKKPSSSTTGAGAGSGSGIVVGSTYHTIPTAAPDFLPSKTPALEAFEKDISIKFTHDGTTISNFFEARTLLSTALSADQTTALENLMDETMLDTIMHYSDGNSLRKIRATIAGRDERFQFKEGITQMNRQKDMTGSRARNTYIQYRNALWQYIGDPASVVISETSTAGAPIAPGTLVATTVAPAHSTPLVLTEPQKLEQIQKTVTSAGLENVMIIIPRSAEGTAFEQKTMTDVVDEISHAPAGEYKTLIIETLYNWLPLAKAMNDYEKTLIVKDIVASGTTGDFPLGEARKKSKFGPTAADNKKKIDAAIKEQIQKAIDEQSLGNVVIIVPSNEDGTAFEQMTIEAAKTKLDSQGPDSGYAPVLRDAILRWIPLAPHLNHYEKTLTVKGIVAPGAAGDFPLGDARKKSRVGPTAADNKKKIDAAIKEQIQKEIDGGMGDKMILIPTNEDGAAFQQMTLKAAKEKLAAEGEGSAYALVLRDAILRWVGLVKNTMTPSTPSAGAGTGGGSTTPLPASGGLLAQIQAAGGSEAQMQRRIEFFKLSVRLPDHGNKTALELETSGNGAGKKAANDAIIQKITDRHPELASKLNTPAGLKEALELFAAGETSYASKYAKEAQIDGQSLENYLKGDYNTKNLVEFFEQELIKVNLSPATLMTVFVMTNNTTAQEKIATLKASLDSLPGKSQISGGFRKTLTRIQDILGYLSKESGGAAAHEDPLPADSRHAGNHILATGDEASHAYFESVGADAADRLKEMHDYIKNPSAYGLLNPDGTIAEVKPHMNPAIRRLVQSIKVHGSTWDQSAFMHTFQEINQAFAKDKAAGAADVVAIKDLTDYLCQREILYLKNGDDSTPDPVDPRVFGDPFVERFKKESYPEFARFFDIKEKYNVKRSSFELKENDRKVWAELQSHEVVDGNPEFKRYTGKDRMCPYLLKMSDADFIRKLTTFNPMTAVGTITALNLGWKTCSYAELRSIRLKWNLYPPRAPKEGHVEQAEAQFTNAIEARATALKANPSDATSTNGTPSPSVSGTVATDWYSFVR